MIVGSPTILNLVPGGVMKCVHVNQVNKNIEIQFKVMNGAAPYNVPEGVTCTIRGTKGDAFGYAAEAAVTVGSNVITVTLTEQLTAVAGAGNIFELVFVGAADDMKVSTENFILAVERQAMGEDTVISDSDLSYAEQVLDSLQNVAAVNAQVQQNKTNLAAEISRAQAAEAAEAAARQAADNTLQSNINAEASTRATQDASLQAQIDQLIAPSGSAPSAAEVENARVGADGTTYPTLGDAIRTQVTDVKSAIETKEDKFGEISENSSVVNHYSNTLYNANDNQEDSYNHGTYSVLSNPTQGSIYNISGFCYNASKYPLYMFFDANDNIIKKFGNSNTKYTDLFVYIPSGVTKIIVNGSDTSSREKSKIENFTALPLKEYIDNNPQIYNIINYMMRTKENVFGEVSANPNVVYHAGTLFDIQTMSETVYNTGNYSVLTNLTEDSILVVSGIALNENRYPLYAFFDSNDEVIVKFGQLNKSYIDYFVCVPKGAVKLIVQGSSYGSNASSDIKSFSPLNVKNYIDAAIGSSNIWKNKTIGVLGTSVAYGALATTSYSYEASQLLGFNLKMFGTPGLAIELDADGTPHNQSEEPNKSGGSFTATLAEYASAGWTIPDAPLPYTPGGTYNFYYKSYENVFVSANADVDLWVYAVVPNNSNFTLDDWNAFNKTEWRYNDDSSFSEHRKTFIGALLFIMNQMYTLNPNARMVFVVDSSFAYGNGLSNLQTVCDQYKIPIINLWGKINTTPPSLQKIKSQNGTNNHPSTFAHEIMGKMLSGELGLIS